MTLTATVKNVGSKPTIRTYIEIQKNEGMNIQKS